MDEKGPQNKFKKSEPFDKINKLAYASDNMHSYVANVIQIDKEYYMNVEKEYNSIVNEYLTERNKSFKEKSELKGENLLKKNFDFGIASMKKSELNFYENLFDILLKNNVDNLMFLISKISIITSARLTNVFYYIDTNNIFSALIFKYVITKYVEVESSENVIRVLLDKSESTRKILKVIKEDMNDIIQNNIGNSRMARQIMTYKSCIMVIDCILKSDIEFEEPKISLEFDWNKVKWAFDLWLTELKCRGNGSKRILFLDKGIPKEKFESLEFEKICPDLESEDYIGLQITDNIVVLIGKLLSKLYSSIKYDFDNPDKRVLIPKEYYEFSQEQFNLLKKMHQYILGRESKYHFVNDTYFDESVLLETYIKYINKFESYSLYNLVSSSDHAESHFRYFKDSAEKKINQSCEIESIVKFKYGSIQKAIESNIYKPL